MKGENNTLHTTGPQAISLRRYLLLGILAPLGLLILINALSLYRQALGAVNTAYDRTLLASAARAADGVADGQLLAALCTAD